MDTELSDPAGGGATLGDLGEEGVLALVRDALTGVPEDGVRVGPGDDTAWLAVAGGAVLATTDTMVRDRDWRDGWSTGYDVGVKAVTQNLADLAAMGGHGTGLLLTLVAPPATPARWVTSLAEGIGRGATRAGVPVVGGDLSSAPEGLVAVSITALGELGHQVRTPVLRSGARCGDVLAVSGPLGRSAVGLHLLGHGAVAGDPVEHHLRPLTDLGQGPVAARHGATAMIDVSDGLVRDGDRIARASGVRIELDEGAVHGLAQLLHRWLPDPEGPARALAAVLAGGEEHELLATFPGGPVPAGWTRLGTVSAPGPDPGVWWRGSRVDPRTGGWDHFGG